MADAYLWSIFLSLYPKDSLSAVMQLSTSSNVGILIRQVETFLLESVHFIAALRNSGVREFLYPSIFRSAAPPAILNATAPTLFFPAFFRFFCFFFFSSRRRHTR